MESINPTIDPEAQRSDFSDGRRFGMYTSTLEQTFCSHFIHALGDNYGDPSGKLWSMYLAEAEKEDKELTEAWKGEADSILVFVRFFLTLYPPPSTTDAFIARLVYSLPPSRPS
jgi:hypothetical protein